MVFNFSVMNLALNQNTTAASLHQNHPNGLVVIVDGLFDGVQNSLICLHRTTSLVHGFELTSES